MDFNAKTNPGRESRLQQLEEDKVWDVLIIGGGATGAGIAVDAAARGFSTVLFDTQDFSEGTSSRSTKLIHGGVRYMKNPRDWKLVREAMIERKLLLGNAPHIVHPEPFILPCYENFEREYYMAGLCLYGAMAYGGYEVGKTEFLSAAETIRRLPHKIIPGEVAKYRQNILVERAVVTERIRLAIGLPLRDLSEYAPTDAQLEDSVIAEKYYEPPLINIISYACNACPTKQVRVTNMCQGCLAHPCMEVCPKDAISLVQGKSVIDQNKCIKCGACMDHCRFDAIYKQ